jgi:purine-binding chemotaxis protein CheW
MAIVRDLQQLNADLQEQKEHAESVDYKIITFSLAGKDYGVDIMNVKEIAKADKFTFVPNAASFVRGVYNLRGDIIPIIDLRTFFHLPQDKKSDGQENMLILRINEQVYGTIVDKIDKVVGINHESIQPPHPIFGDINIKYISGVVEKHGDLYIILDVVRIFGINEEEKGKSSSVDSGTFIMPPPSPVAEVKIQSQPSVDTTYGFIKEGLEALRHFYASPLNETWLKIRYKEWASERTNADLQLRTVADADEFLSAFTSPFTGAFWDDDYANAIKNILPKLSSNNVQIWNLGCGKGYETFSFACILKARYPDARIKIWANDSDIMAISQAPNMIFDIEDVPEYCRPYMVKGNSGHTFNQAIKDSIVFEYHDVLNDNPLPDLDMILARDVLSYFSEEEQGRMVTGFSEKLKHQGMIILGKNEELTGLDWNSVSNDPVSAFMHNA